MRALQHLLDDEIKVRLQRTNRIQAKQFSEEIDAVLRCYKTAS